MLGKPFKSTLWLRGMPKMVPAMLLTYLVLVMLFAYWPWNLLLILAGLSCAWALNATHKLGRMYVHAG